MKIALLQVKLLNINVDISYIYVCRMYDVHYLEKKLAIDIKDVFCITGFGQL